MLLTLEFASHLSPSLPRLPAMGGRQTLSSVQAVLRFGSLLSLKLGLNAGREVAMVQEARMSLPSSVRFEDVHYIIHVGSREAREAV